MTITKSGLISLVCILTLINSCFGQRGRYKDNIRPNIKAKIDSLYPHATIRIIYNDKYVTDSTQEIEVTCHCDEADGMIILVFDTNANLLYKEAHYHSQKNLPDTIVKYMLKDTAHGVKFITNYMLKCYNNKGELSYGIIEDYSPQPWYFKEYMLKFKPTGELISKEEMPLAQQ